MELLTTSWIAVCVCAPTLCALLVLLLCVLHVHRARWRSVDLFLLALALQELLSCSLVFTVGVLNALRNRAERSCSVLTSSLFVLRLLQLITLGLFALDRAAAVRWPCAYRYRLRVCHIGWTLVVLFAATSALAIIGDQQRLSLSEFRLLVERRTHLARHPSMDLSMLSSSSFTSSISSYFTRFSALWFAIVALFKLEISRLYGFKAFLFDFGRTSSPSTQPITPNSNLFDNWTTATSLPQAAALISPTAAASVANVSMLPANVSSLTTTVLPMLEVPNVSELLRVGNSCTLHPLAWSTPLPQLLLGSFTVLSTVTLILLLYTACIKRRYATGNGVRSSLCSPSSSSSTGNSNKASHSSNVHSLSHALSSRKYGGSLLHCVDECSKSLYALDSIRSNGTAVIQEKSLDSLSQLSVGSRCGTNFTSTKSAAVAGNAPTAAATHLLTNSSASALPLHAQLRWSSAVSCITLCYAVNHLPSMVSQNSCFHLFPLVFIRLLNANWFPCHPGVTFIPCNHWNKIFHCSEQTNGNQLHFSIPVTLPIVDPKPVCRWSPNLFQLCRLLSNRLIVVSADDSALSLPTDLCLFTQ